MAKHIEERADAATAARERLKTFIAHPPEDARLWGIRTTSGTTGGEPLIVPHHYPSMRGRIFKEEKRMLQCYGSMSSRLSFTHLSHIRDTADELVSLSLDGADLGPGLDRALDEFGADIIIGYPSFVARVCALMSAGARARVVHVRLSGEFIDSGLRHLFEERFANADTTSMYVSAETGRLSTFPCGHLPLNRYHPAPGVTIEIAEPGDDGAGDILVSKDGREELVPFRRYRVGDTGRIVPGSCPCGEAVTFEVLGRSGHDYLKLAGAIVRREEVERVARRLGLREYFLEGSLKMRGNTPAGALELSIVPPEGAGEEAAARLA